MALIKKGGTSRLGLSNLKPEDRAAAEAAEAAATEAQAASTPPAADADGTRTFAKRDSDSTRSIAPAAPADAAEPVPNDATKTIQRVGTEAIRREAPPPDATRSMNTAADGTRTIPRASTEAIRRSISQRVGTRLKQPEQPVAQSPTLPPGTVLQERYAIEDIQGVGGMSVVYRGRDLRFKDVARYCAIKEMFQSSPDSQTRMLSLNNFEREAGLLATLSHPAIPKVYDFFEENGKAYLVLELIHGEDLEAVLEETSEPLDELRVGRWATQVCDVLSYLHSHEPEPVIFRDLKPSNMMVSTNDRIVLIDFGIARVFTRSDKKGTMIGTEGYSPPEQYRGIADARGDVYALGATLHHLLTGADPRLETPFTFQDRPIRQLNPTVSPEMEAVVMRALEYDATKRWASAEEFRMALLQVPGLAETVGAAVVPAMPGMPALIRGAQGTDVVWKFKCEDEVRSSPLVSAGMLYIGCYDTNLYALDAKRGEFRWKKPTNGGISSSPAIWNDIVIVGSEDGNVYAFDVRTGVQRWSFRTEKAVRSSPRVKDRLIYVGSDDQHLYSIDGTNGRLIWRYRAWQWIRASACLAEGNVVIGAGDGNFFCLDAFKGGLRWKQKLQGGIISSAAATDKLVIVGAMDNSLHALDLEGGWPVWKFRANHYINSSPTILGNRVFVGSIDGNVYAVDIKNGKQVWQYNANAQIVSSPALDSGKVYIGSADGVIHCLDAGSGTPVWTFSCEGPVVSSPTVVDGIMYIGSMDQHVYALKA